VGKFWENEDDECIYFWGGPFSNWYPAMFKSRVLENVEVYTDFNCSEQHMMAIKAILFDDWTSFQDVMNTSNPATQKSIGRKIKGYSDEIWNPVARDMSFVGIYDKFDQNEDLKKILLDTGDKWIVETSPYDGKWGVGYSAYSAKNAKDKWGTNWLGQILMKVRDDLRGGHDSRFYSIDWESYDRRVNKGVESFYAEGD
jgi:ribA/ribD-fused uncharacterized protein